MPYLSWLRTTFTVASTAKPLYTGTDGSCLPHAPFKALSLATKSLYSKYHLIRNVSGPDPNAHIFTCITWSMWTVCFEKAAKHSRAAPQHRSATEATFPIAITSAHGRHHLETRQWRWPGCFISTSTVFAPSTRHFYLHVRHTMHKQCYRFRLCTQQWLQKRTDSVHVIVIAIPPSSLE